MEIGLKDPIMKVGNLDAIRDFTDVRDMVKAYWTAVKKCNYGEAYNICSGKGITIREMLDMLLEKSKRNDIRGALKIKHLEISLILIVF